MTTNDRRKTGAHSAVMESRSRIDEEQDPQRRLWRDLDFYASPPWSARAGAELIFSVIDPGKRSCWEPAAGNGSMAEPLREYFSHVCATDIHDHGAGYACADFLDDASDRLAADWIVTNPPFAYGQRFVELALKRARRGVAMLCRLAFVETEARFPLMQQLTVLAPFAERVPMQLGPWNPALGTATAYAWFVWYKPMLGRGMVHVIPPGTKRRLWRADDPERFGLKAPQPLFDHVDGIFPPVSP